MDNLDKNVDEKKKALREAAALHSRVCAEASLGHGVDRHLFALRIGHNVLIEQGDNKAHDIEIFDNAVLKRASTWELSTSHVTAPNSVMGPISFHEVSKSSTGVVYCIDDDSVHFTVMTSNTCPHSCSTGYLYYLGNALEDMARVARSKIRAQSAL